MTFTQNFMQEDSIETNENEMLFKSPLMKAYLKVAIGVLSPEQRQIIYLRFWSNMLVPEIAHLLGKQRRTVDRLLESAIQDLRDEMRNTIEKKVIHKMEVKKCS